MNFKWLMTKPLTVPETNDTKEVETVLLWEVRWRSRSDPYSSGTQPEIEGFLSQERADEFALSLRNAFKLLRHTSGTDVSVISKKVTK